MNTTSVRSPVVVLIDDEPDFLTLARGWLTPRFDVTTLDEGEDVVEVLIGLEPDLVVLDVNMEPDGFTLAKQIRAQRGLSEVPLLFLTASKSDADFMRNLDAGGSAYLTKPVSKRQLHAMVSELTAGAAPRDS